ESSMFVFSDDLICPNGYTKLILEDEQWCFVMNRPLDATGEIRFEESKMLCEQRTGETLPILPSLGMVNALDAFRHASHAGPLWIGIECNLETNVLKMELRSSNNFIFSKVHFVSASPCSNDTVYVQTDVFKLWRGYPNATALTSYVCARRALLAIPPLPDLPASPNCLYGMFLLNDWCYAFDESPRGDVDYEVNSKERYAKHQQSLHHYCELEYGGFQPSISSEQDTQDLMYLRRYKLGIDSEDLWLGLVCGNKNKWEWTNGETWNGYTKFVGNENPNFCNFDLIDMGHLFDASGNWIDGREKKAKYVACSRRPEEYISTTT
ncbi:hypothetical protein PENTCL1PPCAC_21492, partial [Pristionchus entomophagus]